VQGLLLALEPFLDVPALRKEYTARSSAKGLLRRLQDASAEASAGGGSGSSSSSSSSSDAPSNAPSEADAAGAEGEAELDATGRLQRFVSNFGPGDLRRAVAFLSEKEVQQLLQLIPGLKGKLVAAPKQQEQGPGSSCTGVPLLDLWQFQHFPDEQVAHLLKAMQLVEGSRLRVQQLLLPAGASGQQRAAQEGEGGASASAGVGAIWRLRAQLSQYRLLDSLWQQVQQQGEEERPEASAAPLSLQEKERMVEVRHRLGGKGVGGGSRSPGLRDPACVAGCWGVGCCALGQALGWGQRVGRGSGTGCKRAC
jgi:hypothetical protein